MVRTAASLLLLAALAACDSTNLPKVSGNDGAVRFDFSGAKSGAFTARGDGVTRASAEWAVGDRSRGWITVNAVRATGGSRQDVFSFDFPEQAAPYIIRFDRSQCAPQAPCSGGIVVLGMDPASDTSGPGEDYLFSKGEIHVTSLAGGRVRGTFSGTAPADPGTGALQIVDGSFDVPLVAGN
jgi:hypothetical protein